MLWIRIGFNTDADADTDPAFFVNADPDQDPGFRWPKLVKKITANLYFLIKSYLRIKDDQATGEVFILQMRTSSTSKLEFSSLLWVLLALLDPDPDADLADQNECGSVRIWIHNKPTFSHKSSVYQGTVSNKQGLPIKGPLDWIRIDTGVKTCGSETGFVWIRIVLGRQFRIQIILVRQIRIRKIGAEKA